MLRRIVQAVAALAGSLSMALPTLAAPPVKPKVSGFIILQMSDEAAMAVDLASVTRSARGLTATTHAISPRGKTRDLPKIGAVDDITADVEIDCTLKQIRVVGTSAYRDGRAIFVAPARPDAAWGAADAMWLEPVTFLCGGDRRKAVLFNTLGEARDAFTQVAASH